MAKYRVSYWYDERATCDIEAGSPEEAKDMVFKEIEANGVEELKNVDFNDRDYGVSDAEEITTPVEEAIKFNIGLEEQFKADGVKSAEWTTEYHKGFIDGLDRAIEIQKEVASGQR